MILQIMDWIGSAARAVRIEQNLFRLHSLAVLHAIPTLDAEYIPARGCAGPVKIPIIFGADRLPIPLLEIANQHGFIHIRAEWYSHSFIVQRRLHHSAIPTDAQMMCVVILLTATFCHLPAVHVGQIGCHSFWIVVGHFRFDHETVDRYTCK